MLSFLQVDGPVHWEVAGQVARWVALEGGDEAPVDPAVRDRLAEISAAAEASALAETGQAPAGRGIDILGRAEWAQRSLGALRPVLERLAVTLQGGGQAKGPDANAGPNPGANPLAGMLGAIGPVLLGVQCGFMVGQLGQGLLSQHDLLLPVGEAPRPAVIAVNLEAFHGEWSIPADDLRYYVALQEAIRGRMCAIPWVRQRLVDLAAEYVGSFRVDPGALEAQLGTLDLTDPSSFEGLLRNPDAMLGAMQSPEQLKVLERLQSTTALLESYADSVADRLAAPLLGSLGGIREALRRHSVNRSEADRFIQRLLGLDPSRRAHITAAAFCTGVVERAGPSALGRILEAPEMFPTISESEAPGLWLARIEITNPPGHTAGAF